MIGSFCNFLLQLASLIDQGLEGLEVVGIGNPNNFIFDIVIGDFAVLLTFDLEFSLDSFLLLLQGLFVSTLLLHLIS